MTNANRVLIIDDEAEVGRVIANVADMCGFEVVATTEAEEFRDRAANWEPSVIFLDLNMPGADGIEILRYLSSAKSTAKIYIASGFDPKVIDTARQLGLERGLDIAGTLAKPLRVQELKAIFEASRNDGAWLDRQALLDAIEKGELYLDYQPKVALAPGGGAEGGAGATPWREIAGFEALVRWNHPKHGIVPPMEFIPFAEAVDVMDQLTIAIVRMAVKQLAQWNAAGWRFSVSINVSAMDLFDVKFADTIERLCREGGVPAEQIVIELTETAAMRHVTQAMDILTRLRLKGFRLSMDDFGTGYSSLVQLQRLPFSELKIDRAFVAECHRSQQSRVIVKTMIDLAHNLGLTTVAEGVENAEILGILAEMGCDIAQGYHVAAPFAADRVAPWLQEHAAAE